MMEQIIAIRPSDGANLDKFSWAFTPATPPQGLVDYINLTVRDGKLRVSARQGNGAPNGLYVGFDLPIEALHELAAKFATPSDGEAVERVVDWPLVHAVRAGALDALRHASASEELFAAVAAATYAPIQAALIKPRASQEGDIGGSND